MSVRRLCPEQPASFAFSPENETWARQLVTRYPQGQQASAVIPLLWRAQEQNEGWLCEPALRLVADMLQMAYIRVYEIATFYTMFQLSPVGRKAHVQVCGTTPCMLRGSGELIKICKSKIAPHAHELSADGDFSWEEVECLGSCANAPMVQIWKDTYEDLNPQLFEKVLEGFASGTPPAPGSQTGRTASCPSGGPTSLLEPALYEGGRDTGSHASKETAAAAKLLDVSSPAKPEALSGPRNGKPDDLKLISGIGPRLEKMLNDLGIYHFDQIASWSRDTISWVDAYLSFKGRIMREDWIHQAEVLAAGGETEFSSRQDGKGPSDGAGV